MANGTTIANAMAGVSLLGMLGIALAAGEYKNKVDLLTEERAEQKAILLEQRTLQIEQKALTEDIEDLSKKLDLLIQMQQARPTQ